MSCVAVGCSNNSKNIKEKPDHVGLHYFPKDAHMRQQWEIAISRKDWSPSPRSYLCSEHFEERYLIRHNKKILLKGNAVPTIFHHKPRRPRKPRTTLSKELARSCTEQVDVCDSNNGMEM